VAKYNITGCLKITKMDAYSWLLFFLNKVITKGVIKCWN
jgi:hypothetical protein